MTRWLTREIASMPLDKIESEISSIEFLPTGKRSVYDVERLADLREARSRIRGLGKLRHAR